MHAINKAYNSLSDSRNRKLANKEAVSLINRGVKDKYIAEEQGNQYLADIGLNTKGEIIKVENTKQEKSHTQLSADPQSKIINTGKLSEAGFKKQFKHMPEEKFLKDNPGKAEFLAELKEVQKKHPGIEIHMGTLNGKASIVVKTDPKQMAAIKTHLKEQGYTVYGQKSPTEKNTDNPATHPGSNPNGYFNSQPQAKSSPQNQPTWATNGAQKVQARNEAKPEPATLESPKYL